MKTLTFIIILSLLFTLSACNKENPSNESPQPTPPLSESGPADPQIKDAKNLLEDVLKEVELLATEFPELSLAQLKDLCARVKIFAVDKLAENGVSLDATNDGKETIQLHLSRWKYMNVYERKLNIIFGQLLQILGFGKNSKEIASRISLQNRFSMLRVFNCEVQGEAKARNCQLDLTFNSATQSAEILDGNCGQFPTRPGTEFRRFNSEFSYSNSCPEAIPGSPQICAIKATPETKWETLVFLPGYNFRLTGVKGKSLNCSL